MLKGIAVSAVGGGGRGVSSLLRLTLTVQLAPDQVVAALSLEFADELRTPDIEAAVVDIEKRLRLAHPEVTTLFVKPQSSHSYRGRQQDGAQEADLFSTG